MTAHKSTIVTAAAKFAHETIEPNAEIWNTAGGLPRKFFGHAAAADLCRLLVPEALGGLGLDTQTMVSVAETLARHCVATTFALLVHNNLAGAIAKRGSESQRQRYLPAMLTGERIGAFLLTEPGVGSDATAIATGATLAEGSWTLNGEKAWISNATNADLLSVYAQTDVSKGARGIATFLVEADTPGVTRGAPFDLMGGHALGTGSFKFDTVRLSRDALMNPPGDGFSAAMAGIDLARVLVAAMCCGALERALAEAVTYTKERSAFGRKVADFQGVQWMLADCATDLEASRLLTREAARQIDNGEPATMMAAHAKKFVTRVAFKRIDDSMQTMGAAGFSREYPLVRMLEAAKMAAYLDGATEIQNVVIARNLDFYAR